jgi:hypothetical protein
MGGFLTTRSEPAKASFSIAASERSILRFEASSTMASDRRRGHNPSLSAVAAIGTPTQVRRSRPADIDAQYPPPQPSGLDASFRFRLHNGEARPSRRPDFLPGFGKQSALSVAHSAAA